MCGPSSPNTSSVPISAQQNVGPSLFSGRATSPTEAAFASKMSGSPILLKTITHLQIIKDAGVWVSLKKAVFAVTTT